MSIDYRRARESEREPLMAVLEAAFGFRRDFEAYLDFDPALGFDDTLVAADDERLVACVQIFTKRVRLRGRTITIGGIGSVATHPDYEGQGVGSALLREAAAEMRAREMPLALLFTGRTSFYERLGWVQVRRPHWSLRARAELPAGARRLDPDADLPAVHALYRSYNQSIEGTVERDLDYWRHNLRYAGTPDEDFWLLERDGSLVAYARRVELGGYWRVMEHGRIPGAADELAGLIAALVPGDKSLLVHAVPDDELRKALGARAEKLSTFQFGDSMWRVLDRGRVAEWAGLGADVRDAQLVDTLLGGPEVAYWSSDRF